jgi:hypothetical protein
MSTPKAKSLKGIFAAAACMGSAATAISMVAPMSAPVGAAGVAVGAVASMMGSLLKRKQAPIMSSLAEGAIPAPEPEAEFEISVETAAPVKAMKRIQLRR